MKTKEMVRQRIDNGNYPHYQTKRGRLLWVDDSHYDNYSSVTNTKILRDVFGKFWGYSDNLNIEKLQD